MPQNEDAYIGCTLNFDERVKGRRNALGLTQNDLALLVGVSKTTIQSYEAGNIPKGLNLFRLSRGLKCSIDYLLIGEESPYIQKEWIAEEPFGMNEEELVEYHKMVRGTWLEQYVFYGSEEMEAYIDGPHADQIPSNGSLKEGELQMTDDDPQITELITMAKEIVKSNSNYAIALMAGIRSFHQAMKSETKYQFLEKRITHLEQERRKILDRVRNEDPPEQKDVLIKKRAI